MATIARRPSRRLGLVWSCVALHFSCGAAWARPRTELAGNWVDLPTEQIHQKLLVEARIDGAGPFRLLVDSGTSALMLAMDVAEAAGLHPVPSGSVVRDSFAGSRTQVMGAQVKRLESGGLRLEDIRADVVPSRSAFGIPCDGILGMEAWEDVLLVVDFPRGQVSVARPDTIFYADRTAVRYSGMCPEVSLIIGGRRVRAVVDTGSSLALMIPKLTGLPLLYPPIESTIGTVLGTERSERSQLAGEARLGPILLRNPPIRGLRDKTEITQGNVGVGVLSAWKVVFDARDHLIYFLGGSLERAWNVGGPSPASQPRAARLQEVKELYDQGLIDQEDYDRKVKEILDSI
jgi:hypothetical protein